MKFKKFMICTKESLYNDPKRIFRYLKNTIANGDRCFLPITRLSYFSYILWLSFTQELLLERADLFYQFRSGPAAAVTQEDILDISDALQEDSRYKNDSIVLMLMSNNYMFYGFYSNNIISK